MFLSNIPGMSTKTDTCLASHMLQVMHKINMNGKCPPYFLLLVAKRQITSVGTTITTLRRNTITN